MPGRIRFNWYDVQDGDWQQRYARADDVEGVDLWESIFDSADEPWAWIDEATKRLQDGAFLALDSEPEEQEPCVFISHRQADYQQAKDAAREIIKRGIDVWLDVEDPTLQRLAVRPIQQDLATRLLTALIIEMALLNSSHVLAILTNQTKGSMWVPYEYGRIKQRQVFDEAAAMLNFGRVVPPEYALLGPVLDSSQALQKWPDIRPRRSGP